MNEQQLTISARIEKSKIKRVSEAVTNIKIKKRIARGKIEDILAAKKLEANIELYC